MMPRLARFRWRWPDTLRTVPAVILADEPTSSLDDESCERVAALIEAEAARQGATLVVATHDSRLRDRFERRLVLEASAAEPGL